MTKPFSPREPPAASVPYCAVETLPTSRMMAVLMSMAALVIDFGRRQVFIHDEEVQLRPTEYRLLYHLVKNAGWVLTHDQILAKVWGVRVRKRGATTCAFTSTTCAKSWKKTLLNHVISLPNGVWVIDLSITNVRIYGLRTSRNPKWLEQAALWWP